MRDELLAYLLDDVDSEQRHRIEDRLKNDPIWQHELTRLRSYVESKEAESNELETCPRDLVDRTCHFVKKATAQGEACTPVLPASLTESSDAAGHPKSRRWSLLDVSVVAGILCLVGMLLFPAVRESREAARRLQCQAKLHSLGTALSQYVDHSGGKIPSIEQDENAGMYVVKLAESGVAAPEQLAEWIVCPSSELAERVSQGEVIMRVPSRRALRDTTGKQRQDQLQQMGGSFAYSIGHFDEHGNFRQVRFTGSSRVPILADKPSFEVVGFQSAHHGKCGQNVAFQDMSVRYVKLCLQDVPDRHRSNPRVPEADDQKQLRPDRHWFLNNDNQHAAGRDQHDIVLIRSEAGPAGMPAFISPKPAR